jgi:hemoglobin-like flavoprotein
MLSPTQIALVQESFEKVVPIADVAARLFYARLFDIAPELSRTLFKHVDLPEQHKKLMQALALSVKTLERPEALVPVLQDLGRRHVRYGVRDEHYDTVGEALLWTLEQGLGQAFTADVREAWAAVYTLVADTMKSAARSVEPGESRAVA